MIAKNRTLIFFAVIAVIIVAVPISFYELSSQPEPTIAVVNDYSYYQWKANFYNHTNETCPLFSPYFNTSAVINETGYPNTTILLSIHGFECYLATEGQRPWFGLIMNVSGLLPSNLHPKSLVITQNLSTPGLNCWTQVLMVFIYTLRRVNDPTSPYVVADNIMDQHLLKMVHGIVFYNLVMKVQMLGMHFTTFLFIVCSFLAGLNSQKPISLFTPT